MAAMRQATPTLTLDDGVFSFSHLTAEPRHRRGQAGAAPRVTS